MSAFEMILFVFLIICAVSVSFSKSLVRSVLEFMAFSLIMSIIWILLESPDLGITEAAVGAGVTSVLFFLTLKKIRAMTEDSAKLKVEMAAAGTDAPAEVVEAVKDAAVEMAAEAVDLEEVTSETAGADSLADSETAKNGSVEDSGTAKNGSDENSGTVKNGTVEDKETV